MTGKAEEDMLVILEEASEEDAKADMAEDTDVKDLVNILNTEDQEKEHMERKKNSEEKENSETENILGLVENEDSADRQDVTAEAEISADLEDISFLTSIFTSNIITIFR